jgi:hypothetical protein
MFGPGSEASANRKEFSASGLRVIQHQVDSLELKSRMLRSTSRLALRLIGTNPNCEFLSPDLSTTVPGEPELLRGVTSSRSNIILGEHLSGALIQLLRATYFFKARQQIVRP